MAKVVGKLSDWQDADLGESDFMKLTEGSNQVRIFTSPHQFYSCWVKDITGKQRKIRSAVKDCPLVKRGEKPTARWMVGVLDRKNKGKPSVLEIGPQVYKQIFNLRKKPAWGDPRQYDLDIERRPSGEQPLYVVAPEPKSPLTEEEKDAIREFLETVDLEELTRAPTPEEVLAQLGETDTMSSSSVGGVDTSSDDDFNF